MTPDAGSKTPTFWISWVADWFLERDLEGAILRELETFLLELGVGFLLSLARKRIQLDGDDFYLDLLVYNRKLHRLVAVELKVGELQSGKQGSDGTVSALAGANTSGNRKRNTPSGDHPLRWQELGADRIIGARIGRHPCCGTLNRPATGRGSPSKVAQRHRKRANAA